MSERVQLIEPSKIDRNDDNPRLIFRQDELEALQKSIEEQGILVPLTLYESGKRFKLLDGERRWRCAQRLGLKKVPAIVQPKPDKLQNLMMMFAIHNARRDWDPLPTALKLAELEEIYEKQNGRAANEQELAGIASLSRGVVRRLKKLLALPDEYRNDLLSELEKPRHEQILTVDIVLETTKGVEAFTKREIISEANAELLRRSIISKFRTKVIVNTVAPRLLARIARAYDRGEIEKERIVGVLKKLQNNKTYTINDAFTDTIEQADFEHNLEQFANRTISKIQELRKKSFGVSKKMMDTFLKLQKELSALINKGR